MEQNPKARRDGIVLQEMPDELLVYDLETNKAHCLNETSAFVWRACDGNNSVEAITELFGGASGAAVPEELIWLAIDQLSAKNLLEKQITLKANGQTRREVIKKIGLATVIALPLVSSLAAPSSARANAASCVGRACMGDAACGTSCECNCATTAGSGQCTDQTMNFACQ